jgi:flagellar biosynthetic protein FliR
VQVRQPLKKAAFQPCNYQQRPRGTGEVAVSTLQAQLFFLALTRILAILIQVPVLGGRMVLNQVKIGLGILLAMVMLPWQTAAQGGLVLTPDAPSLTLFGFGLAIGQELLIGTLAGFAAALTFSAVQIAGHLMDMTSGFNAGQTLNPALEQPGSVMDQITSMVTMLLFLVLNGHHLFLIGLQQTFSFVPLNSGWLSGQAGLAALAENLIRLTGSLVTAGVQMSLPVVGALLLADLTLALLARVAPQVQVFYLGVPLKIGLGLLILALSFPVIFPALVALFEALAGRTLLLLGG